MAKTFNYTPDPRFVKHFPSISGNAVNGLGEKTQRRASPFFWHKPHLHDFGDLQQAVTDYHRLSDAVCTVYTPSADRGPKRLDRAPQKVEMSAEQATARVKEFALANDSDLVGIAALDPLWVYEGFEITHPWVIMVGVAMEHSKLDQSPPSFENPTAAVEVGDKYNQASRACRQLTNHILSMGFDATAYQGPYATALNMIPAAIAAGFGELGKHGSMINRQFGSSFRLSAVTTNLPLRADAADAFGVDDFCTRCQVCSNACPPQAIFADKKLVRGVEKWYVDFDKCIPYFGEALGCAACIAKCPWSTPGRAPKLAEKWAKRVTKIAPGQG